MKVIGRVLALLLVVGLVLFFTGFTPEKFVTWVDNAAVSVARLFGAGGEEDARQTAVLSGDAVQSVNRVMEDEIAHELARGIREFQATITMEIATPYDDIESDAMSAYMLNQVESAFATVRKEYPDIFWMSLGTYDIQWESSPQDGSVTLHLNMNYCHNSSTAQSMEMQMDAIIDEILADAPSAPQDAVRYFHDWIINQTQYASAIVEYASMEGYEYAFNIDGVFLKGVAVCEGYTKAFKLLCDEAGIPCQIVFGMADGENHGWNYVQLDGRWYLVDCTWDDPVSSNTDILIWDYFLKGSESLINGTRVADIYHNDSGVYPTLHLQAYETGSDSQEQGAAAELEEMTIEASVSYMVAGKPTAMRGRIAAVFVASGGAGAYRYELPVGEGDNDSFRVDAGSGMLSIDAPSLGEGRYEVYVQVTDGLGQTTTASLYIDVLPPEDPEDSEGDPDENSGQAQHNWVT